MAYTRICGNRYFPVTSSTATSHTLKGADSAYVDGTFSPLAIVHKRIMLVNNNNHSPNTGNDFESVSLADVKNPFARNRVRNTMANVRGK